MMQYAQNQFFSEFPVGTNLACVLNENGMFSSTAYKVLQSQRNGGFVRCMKMLYNGKTQLLYLTEGCKPLPSLIPTMDADSFMTVVSKLLSSIHYVQTNGFLSCTNIDIRFERVYVDPMTLDVRLVYLPLSMPLYEDAFAFEKALRTALVALIGENAALLSERAEQLAAKLKDDQLSLEALLEEEYGAAGNGYGSASQGKALFVISMNAPERIELQITKDEYVIGKNAAVVDGAVTFNPAISRVHCKVVKAEGKYFVSDLGSANGTYLNKARLTVGVNYELHNGDILCLANSDFQVKLG